MTNKGKGASPTKEAKEVREKSWNPDGGGLYGGRRDIGPLLLMTVCPVFSILMWHTNYDLDGSFP